MAVEEGVSLAPHTTFRVGGKARLLWSASSEVEVVSACKEAEQRNIPLVVLGGGSNVLVSDEGVEGVVLRMCIHSIDVIEEGSNVLLDVGAGVSWDALVTRAAQEGWWGIENLAAIPGTVGGAAVQNIGAYGAELSQVFVSATVIHRRTGERREISKVDADLSYRSSYFKKDKNLIVTRVRLRLSREGGPNLSYPDLAKRTEEGDSLRTPQELASAVREIRSRKFPRPEEGGTAGSFFKHPVIEKEVADELCGRYPGLPHFLQTDGRVKVSLTWMLDHVLNVKGYSRGSVRLYEKQPIVVVAQAGASAHDIDVFAREIEEKVRAATTLVIEREVETLRI